MNISRLYCGGLKVTSKNLTVEWSLGDELVQVLVDGFGGFVWLYQQRSRAEVHCPLSPVVLVKVSIEVANLRSEGRYVLLSLFKIQKIEAACRPRC